MSKYEVTLRTGSDSTGEWDVEADYFKEQPGKVADAGPWLVFYRKSEKVEVPFEGAPIPEETGAIEVFRAPLHTLVAVQLEDDEDQEGGE